MALTRQFFQTPTGSTYAPARDIERSFDKTSMLLGSMMQRESDRLKQEEAAFGQLYANIGELEGNLMQNYAGIEQQAIMSLRDFTKEHLKKGGRVNDPEFQMALGERTGRIKAAMSNAERNRESLRLAAEKIKNDPHLSWENKNKALTEIYADMNNPDVLISKNPYDYEAKIEKYIDPISIFEDLRKSLPTLGEFTDEFFDDNGNLVSRTLLNNPLINQENPLLPDGSPNIIITDEFARDVAEGVYGNRVLRQAQRIADERYSDLPRDVAFKKALNDGVGLVIGLNLKQGIKKSKRDIEKEEQDFMLKQAQFDALQEERSFNRDLKTEKVALAKEKNDKSKLKELFLSDIETGNKNYLSKILAPNYTEDLEFITRGAQQLIEYGFYDFGSWQKLEPEDRKKILSDYEIPVPTGFFGQTASDKKEAYDAVMEKIKSDPASRDIVGVSMKIKEGVTKGAANFKPKTFIWGDDYNKLDGIFEEFENIRKKAGGSADIPDIKTTQPKNEPTGGASRFNPK